MSNPFPYTSIHDYLDEQFAHLSDVSDHMIQTAKRQYKLMYDRWYKQSYREEYVELSLVVSKAENTKLRKQAKASNLTIGRYLRTHILTKTHSNNTQHIIIELAKTIDLVELYMHQDALSKNNLQSILQQLETIQSMLNDH